MTYYLQQVVPSLIAVVIGWVLLWPMRHRLGAVDYHTAALPVGLLVFGSASGVATLASRPLDGWIVAASAAILGVVTWGSSALSSRRQTPGAVSETPQHVGVSGFVAMLASISVVGRLAAATALTVATNDAFVEFWPMSIALSRGDGLWLEAMSERGAVIPGAGAVHIMLGADWVYALYPLMAMSTLAILGFEIARGSNLLPRRARLGVWAVAAAAVAYLGTESSFVFHSIFVHANLVSGLFLLLAVVALARCRERIDGGESPTAHLVLAGLAAAGLALARPDGLAYALVPVIGLTAILTRAQLRHADVAAFYAALLVPVAAVYGAVFERYGMWRATKLSGTVAFAMVSVLVVSAVAPYLVAAVDRRVGGRVRGDRVFAVAFTAMGLVLALVAALKTESVVMSLTNSWINLFGGGGGYGATWWWLAGLTIVSIFTGDAIKHDGTARFVLGALMSFLVMAIVIHGVSHPGRVNALDSFTRLAFQALPLAVFYVALVVRRIVVARLR